MSSNETESLTSFSQNFLDETWGKLLAKSYDKFRQMDLDEFLNELQREDRWYSTRTLLLRYAQEIFGTTKTDGTNKTEDDLAYDLYKKTTEELAGTSFNNIAKAHYKQHLSGNTGTLTRKVLHRMALVFHFNQEQLLKFFAYGRGEPPFFWHDATECIYYYVLRTKKEKLAVEADRLIKQYNAQVSRSEPSKATPSQDELQPSTQFFRAELDDIKDDAELINYLLGKKTFLDNDNVSETARQAVKELCEQVEMQYKQVIKHYWNWQFALKSLSVAKDEPKKDDSDVDAKEQPIKDRPRSAVRADLLPVYLNTKHFRDIRVGKIKAAKQDIVFLRFYKTVLTDFKENGDRPDPMSRPALSGQRMKDPGFTVFRKNGSHEDFVWTWMLETNDILAKSSLPEMNLACRFDATVLSALMSNNPEAFFTDVMWNFVEDIDEIDDDM